MAEHAALQRDDLAPLQNDLSRLAALRVAGPQLARLEQLAEDVEARKPQSESALVVVLVGPTGAGKSTMLNALAGEELSVAGVDRPTTSEATVFAPSDVEPGVLESLRPGRIHHYDPGSGPGHVLVDAPDVNSVAAEHREIVARLAQIADLLVVVVHAQAVVEASTAEFLDDFADRRRMLFFLNRSDELTPEAHDALVAQLGSLVRSRWGEEAPTVLSGSALQASQGSRDAGITALRERLAQLAAAPGIAGVRRSNRLGARRRLARETRELTASQSRDLAALESDLGEAWSRIGERLVVAVSARTRTRRADLELVMAAELAKRWRGPGGLLLRVGLWGPLGTAGALALRRNPLAAGALALGGQAVDRVRRGLAERRIDAAASLLPPEEDVAEWLDSELREVRMAADALSAELPASLEEDCRGGMDAMLESAATAWVRLIEDDIVRAVDRRWVRLAVLPLDLPLYGLAAHVGYLSVAGYLSGDWVPAAFYLNAAVLAVLLSAVSWWTGRQAVAIGVRGLLRGFEKRLRERLLGRAQAVAVETSAEVVGYRRALERLSQSPS